MTSRCISVEALESTGFAYTLSLINGKYKMTILYTLSEFGVVRFNEMRRYIGNVSFKTLSATLKELERDGLVPRCPPRWSTALPPGANPSCPSWTGCASGGRTTAPDRPNAEKPPIRQEWAVFFVFRCPGRRVIPPRTS